jgi:hypothetical protein
LVISNRLVEFAAVIIVIMSTVLGVSAQAQTPAQAQSRIVSQIKNEERVVLSGTVSPLVKTSVDSGRMAGGTNLGRMVLMLSSTPEQEDAAAALVASLHDASSPSYHKWLTPAQFGQQFGVTDDDAGKVQRWLQGQGLTVHEVAQSRRFVVFSGTVSQVEQAFSTEMHTYSYNNKKFVANSAEVQIPAALASAVKGVVRLHSDPRSESYIGGKVHYDKKTGHFEGGDGGHYLTPADFATIYNVQPLYDAGIDGTGQSIAIVGRSNIDVQNVRDFRNLLGLPANDPQVIVNGDDPGQISDMTEAMLDVTWSGAVAPRATILFVVSQSNFADGVDVSAAYIVDHNLAPVMSTSYGSCESSLGKVENAFFKALWQQAAAEGITSFVSAGDNGGAGCDAPGGGQYASGGLAVNGISSTPYNVSVGGTQFDDTSNPSAYWSATSDLATGRSALGYIPEKVWNETSNDPNAISLWSGSSGVSSVYEKPDWQSAPGVPNDGKRDVPDISLTAALHDGYIVCLFGSCGYGDYFYVFGGTSASSPAAAGIMALVNQSLAGQRQGMANYVFYRLASTPGVYHDVTTGDNKVPDTLGQFTVGYSAGPGYDLATGLGSFDANALVKHWATAASAVSSATNLSLEHGQATTATHGTPLTFVAKVSCGGASGCVAPTGEVSLLATSASNNVVGVGAGPLKSGTSASTARIDTAAVPGGMYQVAARYSGDSTYYSSSSNSVQVTVTPEPSQSYVGSVGGGSYTTGPVNVGYGSPLQVGIVVAGNSGAGYPTGNVTLLADGKAVMTGAFDPGTGNLNPSPLLLNFGEHSTLLAPGITAISQSSTISYLPSSTSLGAGPHTLQANYPGDASFNSSVSNAYNYTVTKADTQIADFYTIGTPVANVPVHLAGQIVFQNNWYAPYSGTVTVTDTTSGTPVVLGSAPITMDYGGYYEVPVTFKSATTHFLTVNFSGDANTNPSLGKYVVPINPNAPPNISLAADISSAVVGTPVTLTAVVTSDVRTYTATGKVTFIDGLTPIGTAALDPTGTANLVVKTLIAGAHSITASYAGDAVLNVAVSPAITEMIADFTLQAPASGLSVPSGRTASTTISAIPLGGSTQTIQFSCSSRSLELSCSFNPTSATLDGLNPAQVSITVTAQKLKSSAVLKGRVLGAASTLAFAGLLLPFGRRQRLRPLLGMVAIFVIVLYAAGCGSVGTTSNSANSSNKGTGGESATPGVYVVNISATSGTGSTAKVVPLVVTITK